MKLCLVTKYQNKFVWRWQIVSFEKIQMFFSNNSDLVIIFRIFFIHIQWDFIDFWPNFRVFRIWCRHKIDKEKWLVWSITWTKCSMKKFKYVYLENACFDFKAVFWKNFLLIFPIKLYNYFFTLRIILIILCIFAPKICSNKIHTNEVAKSHVAI